jgi:hypothetical protein
MLVDNVLATQDIFQNVGAFVIELMKCRAHQSSFAEVAMDLFECRFNA